MTRPFIKIGNLYQWTSEKNSMPMFSSKDFVMPSWNVPIYLTLPYSIEKYYIDYLKSQDYFMILEIEETKFKILKNYKTIGWISAKEYEFENFIERKVEI